MLDMDKLKAILLAIFSAVFGSGSTIAGYEICRTTGETPTKSCKAE